MSFWNYRIVARDYPLAEGGTETQYAIHEVHYDDSGMPQAVTVESVPAHGDSPAEVQSALELMLLACAKPVLRYDEIGA